MATLVEELNDLISLLPADESAALRKIIEKPEAQKFAQELKDGRLRQSDYSKLMNTNKEKLKYADDMKAWADTNVPKHEKLVKDFTDLETLNKTLETQANEYREQLAKVQAGEMNVDEATLNARVDERLKNAGYMTRAEIDRVVAEEGRKLAKEEATGAVQTLADNFLKTTWPAATEINMSLIEASFSHLQEFGKPLTREDRKAIADLMTARNISDPAEAYKEFAQPLRNKKEIDAEVERRVTDELSKREFPGVTHGGGELGPVQLKNANQIPELPAGAELGDGSAAMAAAKEMRQEGLR